MELYWVARDTRNMAALAISSGEQLAAARWATADRPAPCGLLLFDGGISTVDAHGMEIPIEACTWGPAQGGCLVWLLLSRRRLAREMVERNSPLTLVEDKIPSLIPVAGHVLPVTDVPVPMAELGEGAPVPVMQELAASCLLMQQPQLIDRNRECADKSVRRAAARQGLPDPEVTIVDLRRQYVPQDQDPDVEGPGRRYRNRWVVSGHWRDQAYGPERSLRRKTWIHFRLSTPGSAVPK